MTRTKDLTEHFSANAAAQTHLTVSPTPTAAQLPHALEHKVKYVPSSSMWCRMAIAVLAACCILAWWGVASPDAAYCLRLPAHMEPPSLEPILAAVLEGVGVGEGELPPSLSLRFHSSELLEEVAVLINSSPPASPEPALAAAAEGVLLLDDPPVEELLLPLVLGLLLPIMMVVVALAGGGGLCRGGGGEDLGWAG